MSQYSKQAVKETAKAAEGSYLAMWLKADAARRKAERKKRHESK